MARQRLQTVKPRVLSHTYCQVRAWDFSVVRASENWENWFLAKVPNSMPSLHRKVCFKCLNWLIILIFCSKQELSTLVPNPLLSSAQGTHHSVLNELSAGRALRCRTRRWYWAWCCQHCLCSLPYLTWSDIPTMHCNVAFTSSTFSSSLLLSPRTSNSCSLAETPSSSSPRLMLARPERSFPPNNASWRCVRFLCETWKLPVVMFSYF